MDTHIRYSEKKAKEGGKDILKQINRKNQNDIIGDTLPRPLMRIEARDFRER